MAKILVSFKERERDLYELVNSQGDKSNFIKDALKFYLQNKEQKIKTPENSEVEHSGILDILDGI
ncbi:hypothetical protein [Lutispora thermophila]|uniref:Ribbon-helix-helix protein, copG family n=1 Tax=Lutispora thermophila DSM 19022 TaxID=1122184 RepID=A0A1M6G1S9_9FIRM|nr:hypothetical protein [Lutispora thermophila]SHJ03880.1 hypothetical protein SAMN02745176_02173 [Lutispora thermophila DSM 19022]